MLDSRALVNFGEELKLINPPVITKSEKSDHFLVKLNQNFCQSYINGRNGSNACTVISVLACYCAINCQISDFDMLLSCYIGAMGHGNQLYDRLFHGFPMVTEVIDFVGEHVDVVLKEETNVNFDKNENEAMIFVANYKTVSLTRHGSNFRLFDSHCHGDYGGFVVIGNCSNILPILSFLNADNNDLLYIALLSFLL